MKPTLTVLSRESCHLCGEMIAALKQYQGRFSFEIEVIDVDLDPELDAKWGNLVPVLLDGKRELCHYRLNTVAVDAYLARIK